MQKHWPVRGRHLMLSMLHPRVRNQIVWCVYLVPIKIMWRQRFQGGLRLIRWRVVQPAEISQIHPPFHAVQSRSRRVLVRPPRAVALYNMWGRQMRGLRARQHHARPHRMSCAVQPIIRPVRHAQRQISLWLAHRVRQWRVQRRSLMIFQKGIKQLIGYLAILVQVITYNIILVLIQIHNFQKNDNIYVVKTFDENLNYQKKLLALY